MKKNIPVFWGVIHRISIDTTTGKLMMMWDAKSFSDRTGLSHLNLSTNKKHHLYYDLY